MKHALDRKRLRREYLRKTYSMTIGHSYLFVFTLWITWFLALILIFDTINPVHFFSPVLRFVCLIFVLIGIPSTRRFYFGFMRAREAASRVPVVPPVNVNTLPAEEVLVRGSKEPPDEQSNALLRAAQGDQTPQEHLLRVVEK